MAAHGRRKGQRNVERQMDQNWRTPSRSGSPGTPQVNGSAYPSYKREPPAPVDFEYKKNVEFLKREWKKFETEHRTSKDTVTEFVPRDANTQDFQPFDVDAFLENLHQRRQQQQQEYRG
ncbi:hypothetical protein OS493_010632 [Desmophyllum pertusum]|uniref:Uncharacterized protein n=1 Tax=Desmophyllum pertusum TaxID=174260 RepID=A0A9X0D462_9CNID|nr:hypothetical protein OS493_010632 [Desmophyllum pertusum]